jgi:GMC oxidoreductase
VAELTGRALAPATVQKAYQLLRQGHGRGGRCGDVVLGAVNAGHPGGMLPLPDNLYVADASLFPESLGNPPILTIVAMAKRIGRLLAGEVLSGHPAAAARARCGACSAQAPPQPPDRRSRTAAVGLAGCEPRFWVPTTASCPPPAW